MATINLKIDYRHADAIRMALYTRETAMAEAMARDSDPYWREQWKAASDAIAAVSVMSAMDIEADTVTMGITKWKW